MKLNLRHGLAALLRRLALLREDLSDSAPAPQPGPSDNDDERDIEKVLDTFRDLVGRLNHDGKELGQLCVKAEKRAEHYALLSETVVESVTSCILVFDQSLRLLLANTAAKKTLDLAPETCVAGMALDGLFKDGSELRHLVNRSLQSGSNAWREIREVVSLAGKSLRLGISTSCVGPGQSSAKAVIVVFTALDDAIPSEELVDGAASAVERQNYLRGVLDSYDLISGLFIDFDRIEQKSNSGVLTTLELREFSMSLRRACDTLMAFALSLGAIDSIPEIVDVNGVIETVIARAGFECDSRLGRQLADDLPPVKTLRKVLEVGLCLLIKGCMSQSRGGVEITSASDAGGSSGSAYIDVKELSPSKPVHRVGNSLREFVGGGDMQREAGLFLLASLPPEGHAFEVDQTDGVFHFSMLIRPPIEKEVGQDGKSGELSDRGINEN